MEAITVMEQSNAVSFTKKIRKKNKKQEMVKQTNAEKPSTKLFLLPSTKPYLYQI